MEFKGTKDKWYVVKVKKTEYTPERNEICYGEDGECIAEFVENDYNALLISKSPEMLEMLINVKDYLNGDDKWSVEQLIKEATELNDN